MVPIIVPIVVLITLATWLGLVFWADAYPEWRTHSDPLACDRFKQKGTGDGMAGSQMSEEEDTRFDKFADLIVRNSYVVVSIAMLMIIAIPWVRFLLATDPRPQSMLDIGINAFSVAVPIGALVIFLIKRANGLAVTIMFVNAFLTLIGAFASIYWDSGSANNFSIKLSHLDAIYFTLGTLTTGSGNISAITEYSRGVQTIQLVLDLALMGFAAGVVFTRFAEYVKK